MQEYLKDSLDTGQIVNGFFNSKSIKGYRGSYSLSDPEQHEKVATIYLLNGILGEGEGEGGIFATSTLQEGNHK